MLVLRACRLSKNIAINCFPLKPARSYCGIFPCTSKHSCKSTHYRVLRHQKPTLNKSVCAHYTVKSDVELKNEDGDGYESVKSSEVSDAGYKPSKSPLNLESELLRYNIEEFYPKEEEEEEYEDFEQTDNERGIMDVDKEMEKYNIDEFYGIELDEQHIKPVEKDEELRALPFELDRGETGVFRIGEVCDLLRLENVWDICAIAIPKEMEYAEHMVIGSGVSKRHLRAAATQLRKIWKQKRNKLDSPTVHVEGYKGRIADEWIAMDLGNIIVHLMLEEIRHKYDLETLWSCGVEYDPYKEASFIDQFVLQTDEQSISTDDHDQLFLELSKTFDRKEPEYVVNEDLVERDYRFGGGGNKWQTSPLQTQAESVHGLHFETEACDGESSVDHGYHDDRSYEDAGLRDDSEISSKVTSNKVTSNNSSNHDEKS